MNFPLNHSSDVQITPSSQVGKRHVVSVTVDDRLRGVPPLERSLKHRQLWSTIYRTLGFSHQTLGWLFDASNAGGSPSSGLNSCWLMMNNSLGISWDIVTIVGYKTSNIREMSALFSAQQIDETDRTCRPVSKRLVSQKTGTQSSCWKRGSHEDSEDAFFYPRWIELMLDEVAVS